MRCWLEQLRKLEKERERGKEGGRNEERMEERKDGMMEARRKEGRGGHFKREQSTARFLPTPLTRLL